MLVVLKNFILNHFMKQDSEFLDEKNWDSILINRRKPVTCRMMINFGEYRVCIHRFSPCFETESFSHPHPWPGAFKILKGCYELKLGHSMTRDSYPIFMSDPITMISKSTYEMTNPLTWHSVTPIETTLTMMINGPRYADEIIHKKAPTTQGKQLEKLSTLEKEKMILEAFVALNHENIMNKLERNNEQK